MSASVVFGVIGAGVGALAGGLGGAAAGWALGSSVGGVIDASGHFSRGRDDIVQGPRLGDQQTQTSALGVPRPRRYGLDRSAGNVFWWIDPKETETVVEREEEGGLKIQEFEYYGNWAVGFGEGVAAGVTRIWFAGTLVYDQVSGVQENIFDKDQSLIFRFYNGSETQTADSLMQADVGAALSPGYRGEVYIVFENVPLKRFGNKIPEVLAEIAMESASNPLTVYETDMETPAEGSSFVEGEYEPNIFAIDFLMRQGWLHVSEPAHDQSQNGYRSIPLDLTVSGSDFQYTEKGDDGIGNRVRESSRMNQITSSSGQHLVRGGAYPPAMCVLPNHDIVHISAVNSNDPDRVRVVKIDEYTMSVKDTIGTSGASGGPYNWTFSGGTWNIPQLHIMVPLVWERSNGKEPYTYILGANKHQSNKCVGILRESDWDTVWSTGNDSFSFSGDRIIAACRGISTKDKLEAWILTGDIYSVASSDDVLLYRVRITGNHGNETVAVDLVATLEDSDIISGATSLDDCGDGFVYDNTDDTVMFGAKDGSTIQFMKYDPNTLTFPWKSDVSYYPGQDLGSRVNRNIYSFKSSTTSHVVTVDPSDGSVKETVDYGVAGGEGSFDPYIFDSQLQRLYYPAATETTIAERRGLVALPVFRTGIQYATLDNVVSDLALEVGLQASEIDVTDLASITVHGYTVGRQASARAALEQLFQYFQCQAIESDGIIKFQRKNTTSVMTISESDLIRISREDGSIAFRSDRLEDWELPREALVRFKNLANDMQQGAEPARRNRYPDRAMWAEEKIVVDIPIVSTDDVARQQATALLEGAWTERCIYEFNSHWQFVVLDAGDVVTVNMDDGTIYTARITANDTGAGLALAFSAVCQSPAQYVSAAEGDSGTAPGSAIGDYPELKIMMLDIPNTQDDQEAQDRLWYNLHVFVARTRDDDVPFISATVWVLLEFEIFGVSIPYWARMGRVGRESSWGVVDPTHQWLSPMLLDLNFTGGTNDTTVNNGVLLPDESTTIPLQPVYQTEEPATITDDEWRSGVNRILFLFDNGEVELLYFKTVNNTGDNSYEISDLLRGMRGTDTMAEGTETPDLVNVGPYIAERKGVEWVLLDRNSSPAVVRIPLGMFDRGEARMRVVHFNQDFEDAPVYTVTPKGSSLRPYAPVGIAAERQNNGDIWITWERRTRVDGQIKDLRPTAPLFEDSEEYEVILYVHDSSGALYIFHTAGSNLIGDKRYVYTVADQTEDGIVDSTTLNVYVRVIQLSSQVGRGFSRIQNVSIRNKDTTELFS